MRTDFRSVEVLEVCRDDRKVAELHRTAKGCAFRYTPEYANSSEPPIALHLPKTTEGLHVEGMANMPTYFAGLLPEGVMFAAVRRLIGAAADDLFAILAATGREAIGDIDVRVPGAPDQTSSLSLAEATAQIHEILHGMGSTEHIAAIPGVQPKMSLGQLVRSSRQPGFLAKFPNPEFPGVLENECACMRLARACGLATPSVRLQQGALVVSRFDRRSNSGSAVIEKVHVEDMLQIMDRYPHSKYTPEYLEVVTAMEALGASKATLLEAIRLYVYSYIIGNGDLHAKNVSLVFDKSDRRWMLSPAYDVLSTLPYPLSLTEEQPMALALVDESYGSFSVEEFASFGAHFGIPEKATVRMVQKTATLVRRHMENTLTNNLPPNTLAIIADRAQSLAQ